MCVMFPYLFLNQNFIIIVSYLIRKKNVGKTCIKVYISIRLLYIIGTIYCAKSFILEYDINISLISCISLRALALIFSFEYVLQEKREIKFQKENTKGVNL